MNIGDNIIDTRDIAARIEELKDQRTERWVAGWNMPGYMPDSEPAEFDDFDDAKEYIADEIDRAAEHLEDGAYQLEDEALTEKAETLREDANKIRNLDEGDFGATLGNYHYFITQDSTMGLDHDEEEELEQLEEVFDELPKDESLIHDSYFKTYAMELADDIGFETNGWPATCIDWEQAANELQMDYTSYEIGDETYWGRA